MLETVEIAPSCKETHSERQTRVLASGKRVNLFRPNSSAASTARFRGGGAGEGEKLPIPFDGPRNVAPMQS